MPLIMTLGQQVKRFVLRGRTETLIPDFREIAFTCGFVADAVNGAPKIRIAVSEIGKGKPEQIRIELIPPETASPPGSSGIAPNDVVVAGGGQPPVISGAGMSLVATTVPVTAPPATAPPVAAPAPAAPVAAPPVTAPPVAEPPVAEPPTEPPGDDGGPDDPGTAELVNDGRGPITHPGGTAGDLIIVDPTFPGGGDPLPPQPPIDPPGDEDSFHEVVVKDLVPGIDPTGRWRVRLHNLADDPRDFLVNIQYPETVQNLLTTRVPFQLVNRAFAEALLLMSPSIKVNSGRARVRFTDEFKKLTGLRDIVTSVDGKLQDINLEKLTVRLGREPAFNMPAVMVGLELEERGSEIDIFGPNGNIENMSIQLALVLHMVAPPTTDFFKTAMARRNGDLLPRRLTVLAEITANPQLEGLWVRALSWLDDKLFGGDSFDDTIKDMVDKARRSLNAAMRDGGAGFVQDTLMHLVERDHVLQSISADATHLVVSHHAKPDRFGRPIFPGDLVVGGTVGGDETGGTADPPAAGDITGSATPSVASAAGSTAGSTTGPHASFGPPLPDLVTAPVEAELTFTAGQVDHIVFLMMENRSFDHMLGYRALKGHPVEGITGQEENAIPDGNRPYRMKHTTRTKGIPSPGHHFDDTAEQVAEGAMTGFAKNYMKRNGVTDPGLVISHYAEAELPMYEFIANNFAICDAWHSSHPGPTWPNRFCATTGSTPEVENFDVTDDRIGYFDGTSIFDMLTRFGVDWCYAEGNVSFLRMFDRYRLDIRNVIPFRDDFEQGITDTWENRVKAGNLPSVSYIDPRFIDIPPAFDANDDLPPTDVCHGQRLVRRIYNLLRNASTWSSTLFVITYDEHGGFFDHVPPPGTPRATNAAPQPKVHPDGAEHLGVRVPALIVSPWVDAGAVISTTFDHTTIIKTILDRFAPEDFADGATFGPRTEAASGLLDELRESPRSDKPDPPSIPCAHDVRTSRGPAAAIERDDYHTTMRFLGMAQRHRAGLVD